jgi:FtsH-binding integral membrane protein
MTEIAQTGTDEPPGKPSAFRVFLRVYGVLTLAIFSLLFVGFMAQSPLLAEHGGPLNWTIWNDVRFGSEHAHVPPMLLLIYVVWGVFLLRAAGNPQAFASFLDFTMWANFAHGVLMVVQAAMDIDRYWSKFFTDIPFVLVLALGIYLWRRNLSRLQRPGRVVSDR